MKKLFFILIILIVPSALFSQILKERRVYYLDCSFSMKRNKLWDLVRDNLKNAIDNVSDETTELIVIPFAFDCQIRPKLSPICDEATPEGKALIKSKIDRLSMNSNTMTYHYVPIEDFYNNRVTDDRITYMFLMTDGQDEDKRQRAKNVLLPEWGSRYGNKNVFGFYVMLCTGAKSHEIEQLVEQQEHLWKVETADVNINLIRLKDNLVFNVRNEDELEIKSEQGDLSRCDLDNIQSSCEGGYYSLKDIRNVNGRFFAKIQAQDSLSSLPDTTIMTLRFNPISPSQKNGYTCLVNEKISIKCKNMKERTLNMRFQ